MKINVFLVHSLFVDIAGVCFSHFQPHNPKWYDNISYLAGVSVDFILFNILFYQTMNSGKARTRCFHD